MKRILFSLLILSFISLPSLADDKSEALEFFNSYVRAANTYNPVITQMYSPSAKIIRQVVKPDGSTVDVQTNTATYITQMKLGQAGAKLRHYTNRYSDVSVTHIGDNKYKVSSLRQPSGESYKLKTYMIDAERKSISRDIECLSDAGYSIIKCDNHNKGWYMTDQDFEDYELKILADAVAKAQFLTADDTRKLIKKIKNLATVEGEKIINATTFVDKDLKIADRKFKLKFNLLIRAITAKKQVQFQYRDEKAKSKNALRRDGYIYEVSPYYVFLSGSEYFLLANPATHNHLTVFKIDLMENLQMLEENVRHADEIEELGELTNGKTIETFLRSSVNMWMGNFTTVKLNFTAACRREILKKFGVNTFIIANGDGTFNASVKVSDSPGFYQWLAAYGKNITVLEPENVRQNYIKYLRDTLNNYL